jgi:hypothetical protein
MGYLENLRKGDFALAPLALGFWLIVGAIAGAALGSAIGSEGAVVPTLLLGGFVGLAVGMYAAMGQSTLAKVLTIPGAFLMLFWWQ